MLGSLHHLVEHHPQLSQVLGITTAGLVMRMTRMYHRKGYICLLQREKVWHFLKQAARIQDLLMIIVVVVQMKVLDPYQIRSSSTD